MPSNDNALTAEQQQRAEALRVAARIVAGGPAAFGSAPGVPEDRTFDVQEFARWILKGDDDGAPAEDAPPGFVRDGDDGPVRLHADGPRAARLGPTHITGDPDGVREKFDRLRAGDRSVPGFRYGGFTGCGEVDNAGTAPDDDPEDGPTPITFEGRAVGYVTDAEQTDDGIRVAGTITDPDVAATMGDLIPGLSVRDPEEEIDREDHACEVHVDGRLVGHVVSMGDPEPWEDRGPVIVVRRDPDVEDVWIGDDSVVTIDGGPVPTPSRLSFTTADVVKPRAESFGERMSRLLVETGLTAGDDDLEDDPDGDELVDNSAAVRVVGPPTNGQYDDPEVHAIAPPPEAGPDRVEDGPDGTPRYQRGWEDRPEFRAGYGLEPDRHRGLRRITEPGVQPLGGGSFLRWYDGDPRATPGSVAARSGWALGAPYARYEWHELPPGYGRFVYADQA